MNKVSLKEFDKAINELPKTNDIVSSFSSVGVKELRKAVERFEYVPSFNELLEKNNRLNNIINELEKFMNEDYEYYEKYGYAEQGHAMGEIRRIKNKLQELKEDNK